mmetsp:Transcript_10681/g.14633  ORF Transcript_10681/g.14633 Transcript_10681/m.14633 type:complete len:271 (-) Transcript_10681:158-970(-)
MSSLLPRLHLFEWHDYEWFPAFIRPYLMHNLQHSWLMFDNYKLPVEVLQNVMQKSGSNKILDLCSGAGGPWPFIVDEFEARKIPAEVTVSDYYPDIPQFEKLNKETQGKIKFIKDRVNAFECKQHGGEIRTLFLSFHHFAPDSATKIIQNAVDENAPIAIFETCERSIINILTFPLYFWILMFIIAPFIRPRFHLGRLFFTWIIPIVPFILTWDGIVSCLRTYTPDEMMKLIRNVKGHENYEWEAKVQTRFFPNPNLVYMYGYPKKNKQS